uniref:DUF659 domain-containing protein n=1 Tax=Amphimedon queenslandica TaxID=400682 RepID=A0A1X7V732_AMPQE
MRSSETDEPFLSYTVHFIDAEWRLKTCLQALYLPADHTDSNIPDALLSTQENCRLDQLKQACITTDNGANIVCALNRHLHWPHLPCFGHNLHLAVSNSIKSDERVKRALGICRKIAAACSYHWKKKHQLAEAQQSMNLPLQSIKSDCTSQWGSTQLMINTILKQKDAIHQVLRSDNKCCHLCLTWQDLDLLESIKKVFASLDEFTDALSL